MLASSSTSEKSGTGGGGCGEGDDPPPPQDKSDKIAASVPAIRGMYKKLRDGRSLLRGHITIRKAMNPLAPRINTAGMILQD